ncbi:MAG TPA: hypothetical protein VM685_02860 [Phenylobacterium sp.]|nr:hypothetical protein [Phenylobacterium sp.]
MPRFHFHQRDGRSYPDKEGVELPDIGGARRIALRSMTELLLAHEVEFWKTGEWEMTVTDERGLTVLSLILSATEGPVATGARPSRDEGGSGR